jgi:hypothetical protein
MNAIAGFVRGHESPAAINCRQVKRLNRVLLPSCSPLPLEPRPPSPRKSTARPWAREPRRRRHPWPISKPNAHRADGGPRSIDREGLRSDAAPGVARPCNNPRKMGYPL